LDMFARIRYTAKKNSLCGRGTVGLGVRLGVADRAGAAASQLTETSAPQQRTVTETSAPRDYTPDIHT
jgi:hypothetical protein